MFFSPNWLEGYVGDVPYTAGFYPHQRPDMLKFCCALNGLDVTHIEDSFNYLELGSGMGFGLNIMAALYPKASFYGIDFNPEHIRFSNKIKKDAGLKNVNFYEMSFEEFLNYNLELIPQCDFIVLHGVLSWVSDENKKNIMKIIKAKLKPGGICYISYNNMCGWWKSVPFQRFLLDYSKLFPHLNSINKMRNTLSIVKKLKDSGSAYFKQNFVDNLLKKIEEHNLNYLVHEYLNETWSPLFFTQVLSLANDAKIKYVTTADPIWSFPELFLNKQQLKLLLQNNSYVIKEMLKDYMVGLSFRRDIFVKGISINPKGLRTSLLNEIKLCYRFNLSDSELKIKLPFGNKNANFDTIFINQLVDAVSDAPLTIGELKKLFNITNENEREFLRNISILIYGNIFDPIFHSYDNKKMTQQLNKIVAKYSKYHNILKFFCIPQNNNAYHVNIIDRLVFDAIVNNNITQLDKIMEHVKTYVTEDNLGIKMSEENIEKQVSNCIENSLKMWKNLGIIENDL